MSLNGSILVNKHGLVTSLLAARTPQTQLEFVALLPELLLLPLLALQPVLFMHKVCKLSLPKSYGELCEATVVVVVVDLSFSLSFMHNEMFLPKNLRLLVLIKQIITATIMMTESAPMNEPNKVCLSSIEVKNEPGWTCCLCCLCKTSSIWLVELDFGVFAVVGFSFGVEAELEINKNEGLVCT